MKHTCKIFMSEWDGDPQVFHFLSSTALPSRGHTGLVGISVSHYLTLFLLLQVLYIRKKKR